MEDEKKPVTYSDHITKVQLGDHVETRVFFRRRVGRVVYVPGLSQPNPNMERDGLTWVGIRLQDGGVVSTVVDPEGRFLIKKEKLLQRDSSGHEALGATEDPHEPGLGRRTM